MVGEDLNTRQCIALDHVLTALLLSTRPWFETLKGEFQEVETSKNTENSANQWEKNFLSKKMGDISRNRQHHRRSSTNSEAAWVGPNSVMELSPEMPCLRKILKASTRDVFRDFQKRGSHETFP
jgi:hypothetical protein